MWCLPTHKRPGKLLRFINSMSDEDRKEDVLLMIWKDDPFRDRYAETLAKAPKSWDVCITEARLCGEKLNEAFAIAPNERFYGFLSDDVVLGTPGMLPLLREQAQIGRFAWPNDGVHDIRMSTHPVCPGRMLQGLGFWAHPRFPHNGLDTILYRVASALGICVYMQDLKLIVRHPNLGDVGEDDETYADARELNQKAVNDMFSFEEKELDPLIHRMKEYYAKTTV